MSNPQFDPASAIQVQTLPNMPGSIYDAGIQQQQQQQQAQAALAKTGGFKRKHKMRGGADLAPAVIQVQNPPSYAGAGTQDMYKQLTSVSVVGANDAVYDKANTQSDTAAIAPYTGGACSRKQSKRRRGNQCRKSRKSRKSRKGGKSRKSRKSRK